MYSYNRTAASRIKPEVTGRWSPKQVFWTFRYTIRVPEDANELSDFERFERDFQSNADDFIESLPSMIYTRDKEYYADLGADSNWELAHIEAVNGAVIVEWMAKQVFSDADVRQEDFMAATRELSKYTSKLQLL